MTNKERLISLLGFQPEKNSADGILLEKGIDADDEFDPEDDATIVSKLRLCAINLMELLLTTPDQRNESGFDVKYDRDAIMKRMNLLKIDAGLIEVEVAKPKLRNKSYLW
jgi:hypothetical protein